VTLKAVSATAIVPSALVFKAGPETFREVVLSAATPRPKVANWGVAAVWMFWGVDRVMVVPAVLILTWLAVPAKDRFVTAVAPLLVPTNW